MRQWHSIDTVPKDGTKVDLHLLLGINLKGGGRTGSTRIVYSARWINGAWTDPKGDIEYFLSIPEKVDFVIDWWTPSEIEAKGAKL